MTDDERDLLIEQAAAACAAKARAATSTSQYSGMPAAA